jgi:hypothetical protein
MRTGINIDTVRESKLKLHMTFKDSESTHLNNFTDTGIPLTPTSIKDNIDIKVVTITNEQVTNWEPVTPSFLPTNPENIEPSKGSNIMLKYII